MSRVAAKHNAINLAQGFPDFDPPAAVVEAAKRALDGDYHQYAVTWGAPPLRQALAAKIERTAGRPVDPETQLVVTCGSTEAMLASLLAVVNPGERVGIFTPHYENYGADSQLCGAQPVYIPLKAPDFVIDFDRVTAEMKRGMRALIVCNPANPSGKVFTRDELTKLLALCIAHGAYLITDEVYDHIVFAPHMHTYASALEGGAEHVITCASLSKTYAITGWRLGYVLGSARVIEAVRKVHDFLTVGAAAPLQQAAVTALALPASYYDDVLAAYTERRDVFLGYLRKTGLPFIEPQGAYYVLVDVSELGFADDEAAATWFTQEVGVAPVPGSAFFAYPESRYVRFHFAKRLETLHAAGERLLNLPRRT